MERIVPGILLAGSWFLLLLKGPYPLFCLVIILLVLLAANEYLRMIDFRRSGLVERWGLNVLLAAPVIVACFSPQSASLLAALLGTFFALTCYLLVRHKSLDDGFTLLSRLIFGEFYIGMLGAHLVLLRLLPEGGSWLIIASAVTACSDSGAYFVGKTIGKRKLCPTISPNKTIEGALGGLAAGLAGALLFAAILLESVNWYFLVVAALFLVIVGICGDLTESVIKRGTATKDSGRLFGGHGGVLDRVDSLLFVCPILYYLLILLEI